MQQDLKLSEKHLELLDENAEKFLFCAFMDVDSKKDSAFKFQIYNSFDNAKNQLVDLNNQGYGIFVAVNEFQGQQRRRTDITKIRAFFADKDDGQPIVSPLEPTFEIKTKHGYHAYWVLKDFLEPDLLQFYEKLLWNIPYVVNSDEQVKDSPRILRLAGFLHNKDENDKFLVTIHSESGVYYTTKDIEAAFPPRPRGRPTFDTSSNIKKAPSKGRNCELTSFAGKLRRTGEDYDTILVALTAKNNNFPIPLPDREVETIARSVSGYAPSAESTKDTSHSDFIFNNRVVRDSLSKDAIYVVDSNNYFIKEYKDSVVRMVLKKEEYTSKVEICDIEYNPFSNSLFFTKDNLNCLNIYTPPVWKRKLLSNEIGGQPPMPELYEKFFNHLSGGNEVSKKYILDWIAYSLKDRNITILALAGCSRGIGKSALGVLMTELHGHSNSKLYGHSILKDKFNIGMDRCTFAHLDEVSIDTEQAFESIKIYTSSRIRVEGKGSNATEKTFYGNLMLTNNLPDSLSGIVSEDDRQFSIPELTTKQLNEAVLGCPVDELWKNSELVEQLALHLYYRDLSSYNPIAPLKSPQYHRVIKTSMSEWFRFLITDFRNKHYNHAVQYLHVKTMMQKFTNCGVGSAKVEEKFKKYPHIASLMVKDDITYIIYAKKDEDVEEFKERLKKFEQDLDHGFIVKEQPNPLIKEK